jgi:hypothetical protein
MGTNYYWVPTKEIVKSKYDLLLKRISELNIEDAGETADLLEFIRSGRVVDEYGTEEPVDEFIKMALEWDGIIFDEEYGKKNPSIFNNHKYYDRIIDGLRVSTSVDFS